MISAIQFNAHVSAGVVITVAVLLFAIFSWLEWKRQARFFYARLIALLIAILSLTAFVLRPAYSTNSDSAGVIVLTPGYNKSSADSLKKIYQHYHVVATEQLDNINQLIAHKDQIRFVLGAGLPAYVLPDSGFNFLASPLPTGITQLQVPAKLIANRNASLGGVWHGKPGTITLIGPEGKIDSTSVRAGSFQLSFTPKQPGKFLYELEIDGKKELLPLEIHAPRPLDVLILQQYPSAEIRYLKNFLIDQGHRVVVRTQISKNNFRFEFGNRAPATLSRITTEALSDFDLLVLANESAALDEDTIKDALRNGLGVLWLPSENELAKPPLGFEFVKVNTDTAQVNFEDQTISLSAWPVNARKDFAIVKNKNRVLAGYKRSGAGKAGYQLLTETYPLIAKGQAKIYNHVWTKVVETLARISAQTTSIKITNTFPVYPDEPLNIEVLAANPEVYLDSTQLPLHEHAVIDDLWSTKAWPKEKGWHQLLSATDSVISNFFIPDFNSWTALRTANLQKATKEKAGGSLIFEADKLSYKTVSPLLFFVVFVLAIGFLWLAPKL
ncbi:MAG: hypothetical protein KF856_00400 [Cyclobacteriaceae bacterium]|nr:hypothetical protein [Cyclobacteriaceae bacterium]